MWWSLNLFNKLARPNKRRGTAKRSGYNGEPPIWVWVLATTFALVLAIRTQRLFTVPAAIQTTIAIAVAAIGAADIALTAQQPVATITARQVARLNQFPAVLAGFTAPFCKRDVGAAGVICPKNLSDDREEVAKSSTGESRLNCGSALAFAECFDLDVRMRDVGIRCRRVCVDGNDPKR